MQNLYRTCIGYKLTYTYYCANTMSIGAYTNTYTSIGTTPDWNFKTCRSFEFQEDIPLLFELVNFSVQTDRHKLPSYQRLPTCLFILVVIIFLKW